MSILYFLLLLAPSTIYADQTLSIDNVLDLVSFDNIPLWARHCNSAHKTLNTNQGSFLLCKEENHAVISYSSHINGRTVVLAWFEDVEINSYTHSRFSPYKSRQSNQDKQMKPLLVNIMMHNTF